MTTVRWTSASPLIVIGSRAAGRLSERNRRPRSSFVLPCIGTPAATGYSFDVSHHVLVLSLIAEAWPPTKVS